MSVSLAWPRRHILQPATLITVTFTNEELLYIQQTLPVLEPKGSEVPSERLRWPVAAFGVKICAFAFDHEALMSTRRYIQDHSEARPQPSPDFY